MAAERILWVDDDRDVLRSVEAVLIHHGFAVSAASSVPKALELISKRTFDVLLTDLNVGQPGDGFTVVSAMRRVQPDASTFILTGYPDIDSAIHAIRSQVDDYFSKPLDLSALMAAISAASEGRRSAVRTVSLMKVSALVESSVDEICKEWVAEVMRTPELAAIPITEAERIDHVPALLRELVRRMERHSEPFSAEGTEAVRAHGRIRCEQGYTIPQIMLETRILQEVVSGAIQRQLLSIELSSLVPDVFQIGQSLQSALEISIRAFQAQAAHSLQSSFSMLYDSPHLGVAIADENHIIQANDALLRMMGYTRDQLVAGEIRWSMITPAEFHSSDANALEQLREFGTCVPFEKEFILPDGSTMPFLIGAVRLSMEPLQWSAYIVDLTDQRKLQASEQRVRESESRRLLIDRLAHEINNPLAALMFTFYLLTTHSGMSADARELVRTAGEMLGRVNESVKKVLNETRTPGVVESA
jgi:PAS domain S-box-containing protein